MLLHTTLELELSLRWKVCTLHKLTRVVGEDTEFQEVVIMASHIA
jgi:hypothetical protein